MHTIKLTLKYLSISLRAQMQYRFSTLMMALAQVLYSLTDFLGIWILFHRFGNIQGWNVWEIGLFYSLINISFACGEVFARGFEFLPNLIKTGQFDRILLRPRSAAYQILVQEIRLSRLGRMIQASVVFFISAHHTNVSWDSLKVILVFASIVGGACLFLGLFVLQGTLTFWTVENLEITNILTNGGVETAQYPLNIYRSWFRHFFTFVIPLASINYFPLHFILGRVETLGSTQAFQILSPLLGVLFLVVSLQIWNFGVRRYVSAGG